MHPELFHIGKLTIYSYGFLMAVGIGVAYLFLRKEWIKTGIGPEITNEVFLWLIVGGLLGGKLFFFMERPVYYASHFKEFIFSFGNGSVYYGSFLAALFVLILLLKKYRLGFWQQFDSLAICAVIVQAFGKMGCFMAGCCYGKTCSREWYAVKFTDANAAAQPLNTWLYATQLWDLAIIMLTMVLLFFIRTRKQFNGQVFLIYCLLYAAGRFVTEFFRGDERGYLFNGLVSHSQAIALILFIFSLTVYLLKFRKNKSLAF